MNSSPSLSEQISEKFNQIFEKESSEISDAGEVINIHDNNTEASETMLTENETSMIDYSYESSNDYSIEDYSVFEKRNNILPYNSILHFAQNSNSSTIQSYDNNNIIPSNINTNTDTQPSSSGKVKLKNKNKKRSLLKMRSFINPFSTERERNNSLKKREESLNNTNNTNTNFNSNQKDKSKKIYLKRYSKNDNHLNTNSIFKRSSSTIESNSNQPSVQFKSNSNPNLNAPLNILNDLTNANDSNSESTKAHNKSFMRKGKELLKNKISKSKLLLHPKSSGTFSKLKRKSSKEKIGKDAYDDPAYDGGEHNFIEENNLTYSSKHSSSSKNSRIYRHAQSLYDPNQEQQKNSHNFSELEMFKRKYSFLHKNYVATTISEDPNNSDVGNNSHILLENDYLKAYSSTKPEDLNGDK